MLISQRIAKDPKFLIFAKKHDDKADPVGVRNRVVDSVKYIVGGDMMYFTGNIPEPSKAFGILGGDNSAKNVENRAKAEKRYEMFARLPHPSMFIENEYGAMLVESRNDGMSALVTLFMESGRVLPIRYLVFLDQQDGRSIRFSWEYCKSLDHHMVGDHLSDMKDMGSMCCVELLEFLTFVNVSNVRIHHYRPSRKENEGVPKFLQPSFTYRVVDLFREKTHINTLAEAFDLARDSGGGTASRKAHIVRGHFKTLDRNGEKKLFWWSHHIRNASNIHTHGSVEKDYDVRPPNEKHPQGETHGNDE